MHHCLYPVNPRAHSHTASGMQADNKIRIYLSQLIYQYILTVRQFKRTVTSFQLNAAVQTATEYHHICLTCQPQSFRKIKIAFIIISQTNLCRQTSLVKVFQLHMQPCPLLTVHCHLPAIKRLRSRGIQAQLSVNPQTVSSLCVNKEQKTVIPFHGNIAFPFHTIILAQTFLRSSPPREIHMPVDSFHHRLLVRTFCRDRRRNSRNTIITIFRSSRRLRLLLHQLIGQSTAVTLPHFIIFCSQSLFSILGIKLSRTEQSRLICIGYSFRIPHFRIGIFRLYPLQNRSNMPRMYLRTATTPISRAVYIILPVRHQVITSIGSDYCNLSHPLQRQQVIFILQKNHSLLGCLVCHSVGFRVINRNSRIQLRAVKKSHFDAGSVNPPYLLVNSLLRHHSLFNER